MTANIQDRASIERIYPPERFAEDIGRNSDPKATVLSGVRILSGLDGQGNFEFVRASRHVGEPPEDDAGVFLSPFLVTAAAGDKAGYESSPRNSGAAEHSKTSEYGAFIDRVIEAARTARSPAATGRDDERLRGLRQ
ncbi:MAG TPA: hypothetical protein VFA50_02750 [Stellaceae bacterium]|nr:hypothetical protein [Stellaceae bacterium]